MAIINIIAFSLYGSKAATHRVRISQYHPLLAKKNISLHISSLLDNSYINRTFSGRRFSFVNLLCSYIKRFKALLSLSSFDLVFISCELLPFVPAWFELLLINKPFIFDFDDAIFEKYRSEHFKYLNFFLGKKIDHMIKHASVCTAGNHYLAAYARALNPNTFYLPSVVDTNLYHPIDTNYSLSPPPEYITIGWVGSPSSSRFLDLIVNPLSRLGMEIPIRFVVVGGTPPSIPNVDIITVPWSIDTEISLIQQFDIGIMPLHDTPWARGKCAYKLIQYMSCGVPVIASKVGANIDAVPSGAGLLVSHTLEWYSAFKLLGLNPNLRVDMGHFARTWVLKNYSLLYSSPILLSAIVSANSSFE